MGENTGVDWADHTWNPWWGCTKVSPACKFCYAETWAKRWAKGRLWRGERERASLDTLAVPHRLDRRAARRGRPETVFTLSMGDFFDADVPADWRVDAWVTIRKCSHLRWLVLTKRPENIQAMLPGSYVEQLLGEDAPWGQGWPNVALGVTAENREECERRIPLLQAVPAAMRFLSCEPLLEPIRPELTGIDWVIAGGESGGGARPTDPDWMRALRDQCAAAGVAFFCKQMTRKGPIPFDLMVREFPTWRAAA